VKIREWGGRTNKVIKPLCKITSDNPKCPLHIPQPRKGIYVLNIIVQGLLEKKEMKERHPKKTPKTLMPPTRIQKLNGGENPKCNPKGDHVTRL
jgi:hypothetical protein